MARCYTSLQARERAFAEANADRILALEARNAASMITTLEMRDPVKTYNMPVRAGSAGPVHHGGTRPAPGNQHLGG